MGVGVGLFYFYVVDLRFSQAFHRVSKGYSIAFGYKVFTVQPPR